MFYSNYINLYGRVHTDILLTNFLIAALARIIIDTKKYRKTGAKLIQRNMIVNNNIHYFVFRDLLAKLLNSIQNKERV